VLPNNFCSSPWFHIRIDPAGKFLPCRWSSHSDETGYNIATTTIGDFMNSDIMRGIRASLLDGDKLRMCSNCHYEDSANKVSGRQRQLLKSAINIANFDKTFCASPHYKIFEESAINGWQSNYTPVDLQIDLGNTCNSACIMCIPTYSSKLSTEYVKLNRLEPLLFKPYPKFKNWADDIALVDKFVAELETIPDIKYIHFLGGETLYLKSFYTICNRLIENGLAKNISIGTTTNCTVYSDELVHIIKNFKHVHLGISVESMHHVNDYIRWPSNITEVTANIYKFIELRNTTNLHLSLRITPNIFSIYHIDTLFELMLENKVMAESCNILQEPSCLRMELLPNELINQCLTKINQIISKYQLIKNNQVIINQRSEDLINPVITQIIFEYKTLLENYQVPDNIEEERYNLVKFIKAFETVHNNTIMDYLPEYEEFLRQYGY
jgi:MoaA/NifB/PqqE/SkfB family radical SAM enzyme